MATSEPKRGLFIVVEGLDRSGKTTQCQHLLEHLQAIDHTVRYQKFPDRSTGTGQMINSYLTNQSTQSDHAIHLIFSANRWEAINSITAQLKQGTTIIVDRYSFSGAVYSAAKKLPGLDLDWAWACEVGLPKPDLVLFLDISEEKAAERGGYGEERYEKEDMQRTVRKLFSQLFQRLEGQGLVVKKIDAGDSVEVVSGRVVGAVEESDRKGRKGIVSFKALDH